MTDLAAYIPFIILVLFILLCCYRSHQLNQREASLDRRQADMEAYAAQLGERERRLAEMELYAELLAGPGTTKVMCCKFETEKGELYSASWWAN